jgi:hypothetical protein
MTDIIDRLEGLRACTQKTFRHSPDWIEGAEIVKAAIAEIKRLRSMANSSDSRT